MPAPVCNVCGEENCELIQCNTCGKSFCVECGSESENICLICNVLLQYEDYEEEDIQ